MSDGTALEVPPIPCGFCSNFPAIVPITVNYATPRKVGIHQMYRAHCACGAIGKCRHTAKAAAEAWNEPWQALVEPAPVPMILHCPTCGFQHVDEPDPAADWDNPPHRSHLCAACGKIWRPADVLTTGVREIATRGSADTWASGQPTLRDVADAAQGACMSAWAAGEPPHRVEKMIEAVERLGHAIDPSLHRGPPQRGER
jgi:hypothetical protein